MVKWIRFGSMTEYYFKFGIQVLCTADNFIVTKY